MRSFLRGIAGLGLWLALSLAAAEPVVDPPSPTVDTVTQRRATEALEAIAGNPESAVAADPVLIDKLRAIEGALREAVVLLDGNESAAAGERFLAATEALKVLTADERTALGVRYVAARERLISLARRMAGDEVATPVEPAEPVVTPASAPPAEPAAE